MKLNEIVPWGRNLSEYKRMFALNDSELSGKIIGIGDGPASFNCEMSAMGKKIVSVDPIYEFSADEIAERIGKTYETVLAQVKLTENAYIWNFFKTPEDMAQCRMNAMKKFLADYEKGRLEKRYLPGSLPLLDFQDKSFDIALSSHFLFLYSTSLTEDFHIKAIKEMLRIAGEARIFPLYDLENKASVCVKPVCDYFKAESYKVEIIEVPYEFQKGAKQMLKISAP